MVKPQPQPIAITIKRKRVRNIPKQIPNPTLPIHNPENILIRRKRSEIAKPLATLKPRGTIHPTTIPSDSKTQTKPQPQPQKISTPAKITSSKKYNVASVKRVPTPHL